MPWLLGLLKPHIDAMLPKNSLGVVHRADRA